MNMRTSILISTVLLSLCFAPFLAMPSRTNPPVNRRHQLESNVPTPPEVSALIHRSCFNCHSNETRWPWYSRVPVMSRAIADDVDRGRKVINFSEWSEQMRNRPVIAAANLLASCSAMQTGQMPKSPYPLMHPEARVSATDVDHFCGWATSQAQRLTKGKHPNRALPQHASVSRKSRSNL
jgi:hypothetical protein